MTEPMDDLSIAIIGLDGRFPGAPDCAAFWRNLVEGRCGIAALDAAALDAAGVPAAARAEPGYVPAAANLTDIDLFDAEFFAIGAREAQALDPQHRLLLEGARNALESAGYDGRQYDGDIGVFFGTPISQYLLHNLLPQPDVMQSLGDDYTVFGNYSSYACSRVAHKLNLRGPVLALDTACSSSLVAVHLACKSLLNYECDMALAGGVQVSLPQHSGYVYQPGAFRSPDGVCRSFDAKAQGTVFGSGLGVVVLKRLDDARRDGDTILAVIRGSAINNDGADKLGFTAPGVAGQTSVVEKALAFAGVDAASITYVETHGTGTPLGDPIEVSGLTAAYRADTDRVGYCAIGSVKPSVGHLETAAGIAGLIKAVLALQHRQLPPSLNFEAPNPEIDFASSPFFVNTTLREWTTQGGARRAGVSSFGIGGTNAHLIVEEYVDAVEARPSRPQQLLVLSARTDGALDVATAQLAEHLRAYPAQDLADVAHTLQRGREEFSRRRMLVCDSRAGALTALDVGAMASAATEGRAVEVAFLFPGQGAQHIEMALSLYRHERVFAEVLTQCAALLQPQLGLDLLSVLYPAPEQVTVQAALLDETWLTQPALFCVEYALARQWQAWGVEPALMIGHSIGEYVAACLAGVFSLADALRLVTLRGRLMNELPAGDMLAVSLADADLRDLHTTGWDLAAVNGPQSCVLSGPGAVITAVAAELGARSVDVRLLRTSHAFHSSMMDPILAKFSDAMATVPLSLPNKRFISNVTGQWITAQQAISAEYWVQHLRSTVRFSDGVQRVLAEFNGVLLEVGPGQTLATLVRQQDAARGRTIVSSLPHPCESRDSLAALLTAVGRLWLANVVIHWASFYTDEDRRRVPLPTYPFERTRYWIDPPCADGTNAAVAMQQGTQLPLADWFHVPGWTMAPHSTPAAKSPRKWLLFCDASGLSTALSAALKARGESVIEVVAGERYCVDDQRITLRAGAMEDYTQLFAQLSSRGGFPDEIVHAWCVDTVGSDYARSQKLGFYSLLHLAQAVGLQSDPAPLTLTVLSSGLADVTGSEPLDPLKASVLGPVRVIAQEYPHIACRQIDVVAQVAATQSRMILGELDAQIVPSERIAWRGSHRWKSDHVALRLDECARQPLPWRQGAVYLIAGGLGGLGSVFAEHLARTYQAKLILTGRQALPPRNEWATTLAQLGPQHATSLRICQVQALEAAGAEVLTLAVDVTDRAAMTVAVAEARSRFGEIHGAMHAAGIAGGGIIQRKQVEDAEAVLAPKILGAQVLFDALAGEPLEVVVLQSSLFAITGGVGQVDYCGANNVLDLLARNEARRGTRVVALNWDGWAEVGMAARAGTFVDAVETGIAPKDGIVALNRVLSQTTMPQIVVSTSDLRTALQNTGATKRTAQLLQHNRPSLEIPYSPPRDAAEQCLVRIWQEVLALREVGVHDNFFDLGGTSLLLSEVLRRIHRELSAGIGITELFQFPTINALAARIAGLDVNTGDIEASVELGNRRKEALQRKRRRPTTV